LIRTSLQKNYKGQEHELKEIQTEIDKLYQRIQNARFMRLDDEFKTNEFKEIKTDLLKDRRAGKAENKFRTVEPNVILKLISRRVAGSEEEIKKAGDNLRPLCPEQEYYLSGY
jgi:SMC interacting uncharacterized protein involved in chromosome segregation